MKIFWKVIVAVIAVALLIVAGVLGCAYYEHWNEVNYKCKTVLSNDFAFVQREGVEGWVVNRNTGKIILRRVEWLRYGERDSLAVFCKNGRRGYLNRYSGKVVVPARYERAWVFSEGLAAVVLKGKIGFINQRGEEILPFKWKDRFCDWKSYLFTNGGCAMFDDEGKCGIIDKQGKWVLSPEYDYISNAKKGFRSVEKDGKAGMLDDSLTLLFPLQYDQVVVRGEGIETLQKGLKQIWALDGKTLKKEWVYDEYTNLYYWTERFSEGGERLTALSDCVCYKVWNPVRERWYCGIMRNDGKKITEAIYHDVDALTGNVFDCEVEEGGYHVTLKI